MSKNKSQTRKLRTPKPTFERNANFPSIKSVIRGRTLDPIAVANAKISCETYLNKNEKRIQRRKKLVEITR